MARPEYNAESSDDESSYEIIEWKEFYLSTESDEGYSSSAESNADKKEIDSSYFDDYDESQFDEEGTFCKNIRKLGISIKPREVLDIKEMVKEAVLPFLPAKSLIRFKAVSKEWERWIAHPFLAHKQSYCCRSLSGYFCQTGNRAPTFQAVDPASHGVPSPSIDFLPEPVTIKGSCNGLLLCQSRNTSDMVYYVCNPANEEWHRVPPSIYYQGNDPAIVLAFEPSELNIAANFTLVCAVVLTGTSTVGFEVYSSETRSWKCSTAYCFELKDYMVPYGQEEGNVGPYWQEESNVVPYGQEEGNVDPYWQEEGNVVPYGQEEGNVDPYWQEEGNVDSHWQEEGNVVPYRQEEGDVVPYGQEEGNVDPYWREEGNVDPYWQEEEEDSVVLEGGFSMKGMVYWRASSGKILIFDIKNDTYGILPLSAPPDGVLTQMNGELGYIRAHLSDEKTCRIDIYGGMNMVLKRSIGLELKRGFGRGCQVLACAGGKVLVLRIGDVVYSCNLETREAEIVSRWASSDTCFLPYVNSLVSIGQQASNYW